MSQDEIDAAIDRVRERDEVLADSARSAADGMTAGEGTGMLYQAAVQEFLWYRVPKSYPPDHWHDIVHGAAALFDELGLDRYAAIARSERTAHLLDAWPRGRTTWRRAFQSAVRASGVEPLDTAALAWGTVFGSEEQQARAAVERALEAAIVAGELVPGGRGWKDAAAAITRAALVTPLDVPPGQTLATLVTTERAEWWLRDAQRADDVGLVEWRERAVRRVLGPVEPPADVDAVVGPVAWLLRHASDDIELTQSYIARALVVEAAEAFGWWDWDKPPRSEADLFQLSEVRDVATERRLVRRKGRTLLVTTTGKRLLADPGALWLDLAGTLGGNHRYDRTVAELVAHRLLDGRATDDDVVDAVHAVVLAMGWQTEHGPLVRDDVLSAVWVGGDGGGSSASSTRSRASGTPSPGDRSARTRRPSRRRARRPCSPTSEGWRPGRATISARDPQRAALPAHPARAG